MKYFTNSNLFQYFFSETERGKTKHCVTVFIDCFDAAVNLKLHIFKTVNTQAETVALMVKMTHFVCKRL